MSLDPYGMPAKTECDPDDAVKSEHMTKTIDSVSHLHGAMGGNTYTLAEDHDHDGANSATVDASDLSGSLAEGQLGSGSVDRTAIKGTTEEANWNSVGSTWTGSFFSNVGVYGFYPQVKVSTGTAQFGIGSTNSTSYGTLIAGYSTVTATLALFGRIFYVQASPPHYLVGEDGDHGGWLYLLVHRGSEKVVRRWFSTEPPHWLAGFQGLGRLAKLDPDRFEHRPHPFVDDLPGLTEELKAHGGLRVEDLEVRLVDLRELNTQELVQPAAQRLAQLELDFGESRQAHGAKAANRWRRRLARQAAKERQAAETVGARLEALEARRLERLADIARNYRLSEDLKERNRLALEAWVGRRRAAIELSAPRRRRLDLLVRGREAAVHGPLAALGSRAGQLIDGATRCISDDPQHDDHKHLPRIFRGRNALVKVMTQR